MLELVLDEAETSALLWLFGDGCREARQIHDFDLCSNAAALEPLIHRHIAGAPMLFDRHQLQTLARIIDFGRDRNADALSNIERTGALPAAARSLASKIVETGRLA